MWLNITKLLICLVLVIGLGYNIYLSLGQTQDITDICNRYSPDTTIDGLLQVQNNYDITMKGPYGTQQDTKGQKIIFCADLTLCETSCEIYYKADRVIQSHCRNCKADSMY